MHTDVGDDSARRHDILAGDEACRESDCFDRRIDATAAGHLHDSVSRLALIVDVAPNRIAFSRRPWSRSITIISAGKWYRAVNKAARPIGPAPTIATVEPGFTFPLSSPHSKPVGRMSLSMTSASSSAAAGM